MINVWVDDERPMPEGYDVHATNYYDAISIISEGNINRISLDHDLGDATEKTGYDIARFIEEGAYHGTLPRMRVSVHSANPVGVQRIKQCIRNAYRYWMEHSNDS